MLKMILLKYNKNTNYKLLRATFLFNISLLRCYGVVIALKSKTFKIFLLIFNLFFHTLVLVLVELELSS